MMLELINNMNFTIYVYVLSAGLLGVGLLFTIRLKLLQFRHFLEMFKVIAQTKGTDNCGITPFQALSVSLAARVGTGNIAGVAVALYLGGPGAIFWMWIVALLGMATAYAESTLAQLFKVRNHDGEYRGGPSFYIANGLNWPNVGKLFSLLFIFTAMAFTALQSNSIASAMNGAFNIPAIHSGLAIALIVGTMIFGGIRRIAQIAELIVPFMAIAYLALGALVIFSNMHEVPAVFVQIFQHAFGFQEAAGGFAGGIVVTLMHGIQRGLFSNEAGMGSAPHIAAVATPTPHHPSSQGFVQSLGVFIDTILVCTTTALLILLSGVIDYESGLTGIELTQAALNAHIGSMGSYFIAVMVLLFSVTTIMGIYSFSENGLTYLVGNNKRAFFLLKSTMITMMLWGSIQSVAVVFSLADLFMGFVAIINLFAIAMLSGVVVKLTNNYFAQRSKGQEPRFDSALFPELTDKISLEIWNPSTNDNKMSQPIELPR